MLIEGLIPITLFICIYLAIKAVVDARARKQAFVQRRGGNAQFFAAGGKGAERVERYRVDAAGAKKVQQALASPGAFGQ